MIDLGTVKPGATIRIPWSSFDKDDGSSITATNYAAADILIYKNGSTTERASTAGFTATTDFDSKTGKHLAIIDLADNTTADFFNAGAEYLVAIDAVTVDTVTTGGWIARFRIGYDGANLDTTIATLSSQTSFTLTSGPAEDDALNGCVVAIHDIASAVQMGYATVSDYTGSTKTVTLTNGVTFTAAAGDNISFFPPGNARWFASLLASALPLAPTTAGRTLDVSAGGEAGIDWANVGSPTTTLNLSGTSTLALEPTTAGRKLDVSTGGEAGIDWANIGSPTTAVNLSATNIDVDQVVASVSGAVGSVTGAVGSVTGLTASDVAAIKAKTDNLPSDPADESLVIAATDAIYSRLGAPAGASVSADIAAVKAQTAAIETDTAEIGAAGAGLTALATQASVNTIDDFLDTEIAAIKAKTDNLPSDPADASDIASSFVAVNAKLDTIDDFLDTEVAAIKAKTDSLTFTTAGMVDSAVKRVGDTTLTQAGTGGQGYGA